MVSGEAGEAQGEDESDASGLGGQGEGPHCWIHDTVWSRWTNCEFAANLMCCEVGVYHSVGPCWIAGCGFVVHTERVLPRSARDAASSIHS